MAKTPAKNNETDTAPKRAKLKPRANPYWVGLAGGRGGVSLGYRRPERGPGSWVAKIVQDGKRYEERLAAADDAGAPADALPFRDASAAALAWAEHREAAITAAQTDAAHSVLTVRKAVEGYIAERKARSARKLDAEQRLTKHVLGDAKLADMPLTLITANSLRAWRKRLSAELAAASVNRLFNDFRAALNSVVEAHSRQLPAHLPGEIRAGLKAVPAAESARKQILTDADVRRIVDAAFAIDPEGDFGRLVLVLAATGARFGQVTALTIADVQQDRGRIMIPPAAKGRPGKAKAHIAVPVGPDVLERLQPVLVGRRGHEPLLSKWKRHQIGPFDWEKTERAPWKAPVDMARQWRKAVALADLPTNAIPYALRHSSIVRGLRAGLPVRLVAALHDTSLQMIEKHYAAYIVDATEELARRAVVKLAPEQPASLRVVGAK